MSIEDMKTVLHRYLQDAREAALWKLSGASEYDIRRPLTPTGTNLLGLIKHLGQMEFAYLGVVFGRDPGKELVLPAESTHCTREELMEDMWATEAETREGLVEKYQRSWQWADETIRTRSIDDLGYIPWWHNDRRTQSLHYVLVHLLSETHRHVGQMDILREQLDASAGLREENSNMPDADASWWREYCTQLEQIALKKRL